MKSPESMTVEEMDAEVHQLMGRLIALQRQLSFVPEYRDKATSEECLGIAISHYFEWGGKHILEVCSEGLEDANFHSEASVLALLIEAEDSQALSQKIFEEN
jgi:hypothetical protein